MSIGRGSVPGRFPSAPFLYTLFHMPGFLVSNNPWESSPARRGVRFALFNYIKRPY
jgi:hypothetical protein